MSADRQTTLPLCGIELAHLWWRWTILVLGLCIAFRGIYPALSRYWFIRKLEQSPKSAAARGLDLVGSILGIENLGKLADPTREETYLLAQESLFEGIAIGALDLLIFGGCGAHQ